MMSIHPSHSRKDLIEICEVFNIELEDIHDLSKNELVLSIESGLNNIDYIEPEQQFYGIKGLEELKEYLEKPNQTKNLSIAERERIITLARNIICYCKCGFHIGTMFESVDEVIESAHEVAQHCDISTCRRAITKLRWDKKIVPPIEPILSNKIKRQLIRKEELRIASQDKLRVKKGKVYVIFD